jgi:hypothetical protein
MQMSRDKTQNTIYSIFTNVGILFSGEINKTLIYIEVKYLFY